MTKEQDLVPYCSGLGDTELRSRIVGFQESQLRIAWIQQFNILGQVNALFHQEKVNLEGLFLGGSIFHKLCKPYSDIDIGGYGEQIWGGEQLIQARNIGREKVLPALVHDRRYVLHLIIGDWETCTDPNLEEILLKQKMQLRKRILGLVD